MDIARAATPSFHCRASETITPHSRTIARPNSQLTQGASTRKAAGVFGRLLEATRPGARAADLYEVAARAYETAGFPREELKHHQGGAIGYRARDWVAHPRSQEVVSERQAFAWHPLEY